MTSNPKFTKLYDSVVEIRGVTDTQKIILSKIMSFEASGMPARMGNNFFSKQLGLSTRQIRRHLQRLEELQLIIRLHTSNGRVLKLGPKCPTPWTKKSASNGHIRPSKEDDIDHLLDKLNKNT